MSEYQYVAFRAVDAPVSGDDLEFMHEQSSRADITPYEFTNEYHYGDFGGDAEEMLRRGYDVHVHYASFGIRKIMIRLPHGLPHPEAADQYLVNESLALTPDDSGPGLILSIDPFFEPGDLEEYLALPGLLDDLEALRQEIVDGDLRPLYLAALAVGADDEDCPDPPLPAGMKELSEAQLTLAAFFGIDDAMLSVVGAESLPLPRRPGMQQACADWVRRQPAKQKDAWLCQLVESTDQSVRQSILQQYWQSESPPSWPTTIVDRNLDQILQATYAVQEDRAAALEQKQQDEWRRRLATIAANPMPLIRQAQKLIDSKRSSEYAEAARLLCDVRDALAGTDRAGLAISEARRLKEKYPHRRAMIATLRQHGLLPR
ncbi:hypothetical protein Mal4_24380 [Maioricimonas rarisocia]|uniref:Uncharacterized protein n=1 Tax=Maioricimonas rarisocia TaxID=2528026 RepID=A0A517Z6J7_9PLAN|nr:hypothetical protein [Maioricimonas rarisocia]QDU38116.1 hypothetical protein Mal4_24380 [Maioricimonas rarisocia]